MTGSRRAAIAAASVLGLFFTVGRAQAKDRDDGAKVVYHINDSAAQATSALRNMRNQLDVAPGTKIVAVAHADGLDFLRVDAKDPKDPNIDYASLVNALASRGVRFEICEITMNRANLNKDDFVMDADFVPSGVARITELQNREHYAYLKP